MKTQQQFAFDRALQGVRKQGKPSHNANKKLCAYRGTGGTKCAIGHLIPDNLYKPEFDYAANSGLVGLVAGSPDFLQAIKAGGVDPEVVGTWFLKDLQRAHDEIASEAQFLPEFEKLMQLLAKAYGLEYKENVT